MEQAAQYLLESRLTVGNSTSRRIMPTLTGASGSGTVMQMLPFQSVQDRCRLDRCQRDENVRGRPKWRHALTRETICGMLSSLRHFGGDDMGKLVARMLACALLALLVVMTAAENVPRLERYRAAIAETRTRVGESAAVDPHRF
jgi:hypothetical protein